MSRLFLAALLALCAGFRAEATIAFDAVSEGTGTTTLSWTHAPVGTPRGIFVFCIADTSSTDVFSGATYGGVSMLRITSAADTATEPGFVEGYFLGVAIPTGNQTVVCTISSGSTAKHGAAISVTAGTDTRFAGTTGCAVNNNAANPSCTVTGTLSKSYGAAGFFSGLPNETDITAGSGETLRISNDFGATVTQIESSTSEQATHGNHVLNFTSATDDVAMVGIVIEEGNPAAAGAATPLIY